MHRIQNLLFVALISLGVSGCAFVNTPLVGIVYTDMRSPVAATSSQNSTKVGTAEATSILGIVAQGDASIEAAAQSAGITQIHHVDQESTSILGIYATYTVYVYGD